MTETLTMPAIDKETQISENSALDEEVRTVFEPRYGRKLSNQEVWEIRFNLRNFALTILEITKSKKGGINAQSLSGAGASAGGGNQGQPSSGRSQID